VRFLLLLLLADPREVQEVTFDNIGTDPIDRNKKIFHHRPPNRFPTNRAIVSILETTPTKAQKSRKGTKRHGKA
jgi:hypothetical protein